MPRAKANQGKGVNTRIEHSQQARVSRASRGTGWGTGEERPGVEVLEASALTRSVIPKVAAP